MKRLHSLLGKMRSLHPLSKTAIGVGCSLMVSFYIIAIAALLIAPHAADYFYAMSVHNGALQAAPACLAVGVCSGLVGDLMLRGPSDDDSENR